MHSPNMRSSFSSPSAFPRQSFLSSSSAEFELVKKRQVNFPAGSPNIGTKRMPPNFEKPIDSSQSEYSASISMHENASYMTATELRVEDYFHLRTAPTSSELYKNAYALGVNFAFNRSLLNNVVKEPNLNLPVYSQQMPQPNANPLSSSGVSTSNVYHTSADRLGMLGKRNFSGPEISNSIRSLQENSFNCNLNANVHQPIA